MSDSHQQVSVQLGDRSYDIRIGNGILAETPQYLGQKSGRFLIVTDEHVQNPHANDVLQAFRGAGAQGSIVTVAAGERSKSLSALSTLYDKLVAMSANRRTTIVAVGGGVIGDLAGFLAATYARGLPFVQVPTTLLAMVDSSVGGKTGINHTKGKNLIGAFHQPRGVVIDIQTLNTLPDREYRSGLAEVIKYGVILDEQFFAWLEDNIDGMLNRDANVLAHIVARSCELKAAVVREDEFETTGLRAVLNYGHTFAHAFEALSGYDELLHGEAVSIGMICASRLAVRLGRIPAEVTDRQVAVLKSVGLPVEVPENQLTRQQEIVDCMMLDKKTVDGQLRFILPDSIGHVETVEGVDASAALECLTTT
ncbi:MAG: 3-dehydroquinate synthase [Fuerstiella sp.]|nr:3-dehydroquinate synthase [Fuerstiella sp.]